MKKLIIIPIILILTGCGKFQPDPRPWTTEEKTLLVVSCLAAAADTYTQTRVFDNDGYEANPIPGRHPPKSRFVGYMITSQMVAVLVAHYFPEYRRFVMGGKTIVNTSFAIHNSGVK